MADTKHWTEDPNDEKWSRFYRTLPSLEHFDAEAESKGEKWFTVAIRAVTFKKYHVSKTSPSDWFFYGVFK